MEIIKYISQDDIMLVLVEIVPVCSNQAKWLALSK